MKNAETVHVPHRSGAPRYCRLPALTDHKAERPTDRRPWAVTRV